MKKLFKLEELTMDKKYYPRISTSWRIAYVYSEAMKTGAKFPPIVVAKWQNKNIVVDGWHRVQATKLAKKDYIDAVIIHIKDEKDLWLHAIRYNADHGKPYTVQEKVRLIDKMQKLGFPDKEISLTLGIQLAKLNPLRDSRTVFTHDKKPVYLKGSVKNIRDNLGLDAEIENDFEERQKILLGADQLTILKNVIFLLEGNLFDLENPSIIEGLERLQKIIRDKKWNSEQSK